MPTPTGVDLEAVTVAILKAATRVTALVPPASIATQLPADLAGAWLKVTALGGTSPAEVWLDASLVQLDAYADSTAAASLVAREARAALKDAHGSTAAGAVVSVRADSTPRLIPDDAYTPARPRYVVEAVLTCHPAP